VLLCRTSHTYAYAHFKNIHLNYSAYICFVKNYFLSSHASSHTFHLPALLRSYKIKFDCILLYCYCLDIHTSISEPNLSVFFLADFSQYTFCILPEGTSRKIYLQLF